ncbi:MAG TPA: LuxR C-terminal-related transcriptional regulator [Micromonosporaceae bacterium]|nr:LuxR C-terminal-related transcriptional regulator [Micromonosporaceae bacterium]
MMPVSMVGRADELVELVGAWARVAAGDAPTACPVVITGAAGLGKSMLVSSALDAFRPRPRAVLAGAARVHTPAPYDWLAAVLSGRDTDGLPVPADALAWLAQHPDAPTERYAPGALLRLAVRTVRALVGSGPVVLVVEDLHALDPASLNLVGELAAAPELPALLLVTSRPPEAALSPQLAARALARLSGAPGAVRQHLGPLGPAEVGEVLAQVHPAAPVPEEVARAVWRRTGGNPYWLTELLATAAGGGLDALAREPLPEHVRLAAPPAPAADAATLDPSVEAELTAREIEVLGCLAAGMSNKQVARSLGISIRTVTVHVSNLLRKTRSASRTEAALWAVHRQISR